MNLKKLMNTLFYCFVILFGSYHVSSADIYTVTNINDSGTGTLRDAISQANLNTETDTIEFSMDDFPEGTITAITISSNPNLTLTDGSTTIDGDGRVLLTTIIDVDTRPTGIRIESSLNVIRGLQIFGFWQGIDLLRGATCQQNTIEGNVISNNKHIGISLGGIECSENRIIGNYIGLNPSGTEALGFQATGIDISNGAHHNTVGGPTTEEKNIISGNQTEDGTWGVGVSITDTAGAFPSDHENVVMGNYIGTDVTGSISIPNDWGGVAISNGSVGNLVENNVISGNSGYLAHGIRLGSSNTIKGNIIGLSADGANPLPNGIGIHGKGDNIVIGGLAPNEGNIISGNTDRGIWLYDGDSGVIEGNYIGTDPEGNNFANLVGIRLASSQATVNNWRIGPKNFIWYNTTQGIRIDQGADSPAVQNAITQNSIAENGDGSSSKAIDLSGSPVAANEEIEPPVISSVTINTVTGEADVPDDSIIEIFNDSKGQGKIYIGSTNVLAGSFIFTGTLPPGAVGGNLTATVTDPEGNTSEFSQPAENDLSASVDSVWFTETVDDSIGYFSKSSSLALDALGNPHISYRANFAGGYHDLKYATQNGNNWDIGIVDPDVYAGEATSIALDNSGNPYISYNDFGRLQFASRLESMTWNIQIIDSVGRTGSHSSIAIDSANGFHVSYDDYTDNTNINLKYAFRGIEGWELETLDSEGSVGAHTSLSVDTDYLPHISYLDWDNRDIKYARYDGSEWDIEIVDAGDYNWFSSLALDSADNPHISYFSQREDWWSTELRYAYHNGVEWLIQTIDQTSGGYGTYTSIALDSSGHPHISYDMGGALRYAYFDGSSWHIETVDSEGWAGYYNSIALDASGSPHISYLTHYDADNVSLKYAQRRKIGLSESETVTTSEGDMTVSISEGNFDVLPAILDSSAVLPDGFLTPYGALSFTISTDYDGATVTVILTVPEEFPTGTVLFKCISGICSPITDAKITGNKAVFDITDGGDLDEDDSVNSKIVEPSVLAIPANPEVPVDIKPQSCPNPINIKNGKNRILPVAVLGTSGFDVTRIEPSSIMLEGVAPLRWSLKDVATPFEPFTGKGDITDCNNMGPDGFLDLNLKFSTNELVQTLELLLGRELEDGEDMVLRLIGNLKEKFGRAQFVGEDVVVIKNKMSRKNSQRKGRVK